MWWAAASLGLSALGAAGKYFGAQGQADQMRRETDEQVRRFRAEAAQRLGQAKAAGAASGVEYDSGSLQDYLGKMTTELEAQASWMSSAGYRRAAAVDDASTLGLVGDLGSGMFSFGAANNWWRKPGVR